MIELLIDKHVKFIQSLDKKQDELEYWMSEHLRLSGIYWGLTCLFLLGREDALDRQQVIDYVKSCQAPDGGFGGHKGYDSHLLYTLSAIQILVMYNALHEIDCDKVATYVCSLQKPDGSFMGDEWGEVDTRFSYCAASCLSLINHLHRLDIDKTVEFIDKCQNFDGGFGSMPGAESHAGQIFCCIGALHIMGRLHDVVDEERVSRWLAERQLPSGGLNGRPEKLPDVCYSWWVLSSLSMMNRIDWIDRHKLISFILEAQDEEMGGIADRPGDASDVFHTLFGVAGLSLLGYQGLQKVDPVYCMPAKVLLINNKLL